VQRKWLILSAVSLGSLMSTLDGSIVNIALPAIQTDFGIDLTTVEWVVVAYLLIVGSLLLPVGRLGEVATFKRVYLAGFAVFSVSSVLCGLSPNELWLIGFRSVQACGAAAIMAMGPAVVARTFDATERGRALGLNGVSVSLGLSLGPALGGVLTQVASWRPRARRASGRSTSAAPPSRASPCSACCWRFPRARAGAGRRCRRWA
jgi:MFS family permease